ncbi:MAG: NAD-dependent malic enzyme [Armatimonadetes bacterium]|nr:NAD-dependent malic enzyme [Armatimonadota bacterium]
MEPDAIPVRERGSALLRNPILNKGSAFTEEERAALGLSGLLPPHVSTLDEQVVRVLENLRAEPTPLDKYIYLRAVQDRNETLFHAVLTNNLDELAPIVYTPTVAEGVRRFSHIFRTSRGLYITPGNIDRIDEILANGAAGDVGVIVCTDNEGILGIGDQGVGGIAIPIGKLALYVAAGGFAPTSCLPISLDVGTENEELLRDPLYIGLRRHRLNDEEYAAFIEAFVAGVRRQCPRAVLQWEDFSRERAYANLDRYRDALPSFNDDIQGTAAVVHAALLGALKLAGRRLTDETICIVGAGDAGVGVASGLIAAMAAEGLLPQEARARVHVFDTRGLVVSDRPNLPAYKRRIATEPEVVRGWGLALEQLSLAEVVQATRPGVLLGLSGSPGAIPREVVEQMAMHCDRPIIFALSNPSANVDAHPHDLVRWTGGRGIIATGSPFEPLAYEGRTVTFSQANNVYVFPGIGAGAHLSGTRCISDAMLVAAASAVHEMLTPADLQAGRLLPPLTDLRSVAVHVAAAVMRAATTEGLATHPLPDDPEGFVEEWQYVPKYRRYVAG